MSASYAHDLDNSKELYSNFTLDFRQYVRMTARSNLAVRLWGSFNDGEGSNPVFFGGLDTLRGYEFPLLGR